MTPLLSLRWHTLFNTPAMADAVVRGDGAAVVDLLAADEPLQAAMECFEREDAIANAPGHGQRDDLLMLWRSVRANMRHSHLLSDSGREMLMRDIISFHATAEAMV